jgi:hypothetical protein
LPEVAELVDISESMFPTKSSQVPSVHLICLIKSYKTEVVLSTVTLYSDILCGSATTGFISLRSF